MEVLKRLLMVLGAVFIALLLVGGCIFGVMAYRGNRLDKSSQAFVDQSVPIIVSSWSQGELLKRASPQLLESIGKKPEQTQQIFTWFSSLGALKHYDGAKGQAKVFYDTNTGSRTTADYAADATFEHGEAKITVTLIQVPSGQWQYLGFHVNSPALIKQPESIKQPETH